MSQLKDMKKAILDLMKQQEDKSILSGTFMEFHEGGITGVHSVLLETAIQMILAYLGIQFEGQPYLVLRKKVKK